MLLEKGYPEDELKEARMIVLCLPPSHTLVVFNALHLCLPPVLLFRLCVDTVQVLKKNRDEEGEHLQTGVDQGAEQVRCLCCLRRCSEFTSATFCLS